MMLSYMCPGGLATVLDIWPSIILQALWWHCCWDYIWAGRPGVEQIVLCNTEGLLHTDAVREEQTDLPRGNKESCSRYHWTSTPPLTLPQVSSLLTCPVNIHLVSCHTGITHVACDVHLLKVIHAINSFLKKQREETEIIRLLDSFSRCPP